MKKINLTGLKVALAFFAGSFAFFVAEKSASASIIWFLHQPKIPESLIKKD